MYIETIGQLIMVASFIGMAVITLIASAIDD